MVMHMNANKTITIRNANDDKDKNGCLGKAVLQVDEVTKVYQVRFNARYCNSNINIVNPTADPVEVQVWVTQEKTPSDIDLVESKVVLQPDAVYVRTNMVMGPSETVFAKSNKTGVVIRIEGFENNLL